MANRKVRPLRPAPPQSENATPVSGGTPAVPTAPVKSVAPSARNVRQQATAEQFQAEYAYVVKDLRRILILALAMFALLIILNVVLQAR